MTEDQLDATFFALADPTRRAILARLSEGDASVGELCRPFQLSQPAISKHLKILERAGLVRRGAQTHRRPCQLDVERLRAAAQWLGTHAQYWEASFNRLDDLLVELQENP